jgi:D-alanine-D-alanine ligase
MRSAVVFGGPSPEHDVSILTGLQTLRAMAGESRFEPSHALYWDKTGRFFDLPPALEAMAFADGTPSGARPVTVVAAPEGAFTVRKGRLGGRDEPLPIEIVVNCCHGGPGEDGTLQALLDVMGIPYTGPSMVGAALGMDKLCFWALAASAGLPTLPRVALVEGSPAPAFPGPYIVKPRFGGSSIGIDVVSDFPTALTRLQTNRHLRRGAVLEPFREELFDLQVAARSWPKRELSAVERPLRADVGSEILGYGEKYVGGEGMVSAPRELPAVIAAGLEEKLRESAALAADLCMVRGVARIDFLSDGDALFLNEVNTIPGSLARHLFVDPPVPFETLLADMIDEALAVPSAHFSAAGADGSVLRSAGAIASKLA